MKQFRIAFVALALTLIGTYSACAEDPDALWKLIDGQCVPNQMKDLPPKPCVEVDLTQGQANGYVVLKDREGATQYLLMPTAKITGIESPLILAPDAPNYFGLAWRERYRMDIAGKRVFPRDAVSLSINSMTGRSQNQLHIHIDCIAAPVRAALQQQAGAIGDRWAPLPVPLAGHPYMAMRVAGENLDAVNPFQLLAQGVPGAAADMGHQDLLVAGVTQPDGKPGFVILAGRSDLMRGNRGSAEELQDHSCQGI